MSPRLRFSLSSAVCIIQPKVIDVKMFSEFTAQTSLDFLFFSFFFLTYRLQEDLTVMIVTVAGYLLLQFLWYCRKKYFVLLRGISVCNNKGPSRLMSWNAVEQLFKKTQFLVNQSAILSGFVFSYSPTQLLSAKFSNVCAFQD